MNNITELRQTSENNWVAKYQGNYGLYTIRITTDGKKTTKFSCSCPSDYYPCKHIAMIEEAIAEEIASNKKRGKHGEVKVADLIKNVPGEKLREFISAQSKYNPQLFKAVFLEFAPENENKKSSTYHTLLRNALASVLVDDDYCCSEGGESIDVLDDLLDKAWDCVESKQYDKAILICKACIEEYSDWLNEADGDEAAYMFFPEYQSEPFEILEVAAKHTDKKELFDYCMTEMKKKKYAETDFDDCFHGLLASLASAVDSDSFIALQDKLLEGITDKSSREAEKILQRKIDFFRQRKQTDKVWALLEENVQIDSFLREAVKRKIKEKNFLEVKKLIADYFRKTAGENNAFSYYHNEWNELLLEIAQKEKDIPTVRDLAYRLIEHHFEVNFFTIYKTSFSPAEWPTKREELLAHYAGGKYFSYSAAEFLKVEKDVEGLLNYVEKHLSLQDLKDYYKVFASAYPEKTLALFQKAINSYAKNNTGRSCYDYIVTVFKKMVKIKGGKEVVVGLVEDYKIRYKNRKAMIEILNRFQKNSL